MKKSINKYLNIFTIILITILFSIHSYFSYKTYIENQSINFKKTISYLAPKIKDENILEILEDFNLSNKDITIFYKNKEKIYRSNDFDMNLYKSLKQKNQNLYVEKNILKDTIFIYQKTYPIKLVLLKKENIISKLNYFNLNYYLFAFIIMMIIKNLLIGKIIDKMTEYKIKDIDHTEEMLQSRVFDIKNITDNMEEGFIYFNNKGIIKTINESAKILLGVNKTDTLDNLFDNEIYKKAIKESRILSKAKSIDIKIKNKDIKLFIDPVLDGREFAYIILAIDNSENKKAEIMRREFSANVTHELKSPLTSINGYAELIATGLAKNEDIIKFAKIIYQEGKRLLNIIDDILKLSKLDEKNFEKEKTLVNIRDISNTIINKFKYLTDEKSLIIENNIKDKSIKTHESLFIDLISNIYENAIKYNKDGGKIKLDLKKEKTKYLLSITDTGIGIKKQDLNRIFERFYVADKSRTRTIKSTGLGLSIVKHICDYLHYDIEVSSKYNEGSTFTIIIDD